MSEDNPYATPRHDDRPSLAKAGRLDLAPRETVRRGGYTPAEALVAADNLRHVQTAFLVGIGMILLRVLVLLFGYLGFAVFLVAILPAIYFSIRGLVAGFMIFRVRGGWVLAVALIPLLLIPVVKDVVMLIAWGTAVGIIRDAGYATDGWNIDDTMILRDL